MAKYQTQSEPETEIPGLPESIRLLLASAASYLHARLELFSLEFKDAGANYVKILICLIVAIATLLFGLVFMVCAMVYFVTYLCYLFLHYWPWGWVFFGFGFLMLAVTVGCLLVAKSRFGLASFATTISELKKDKEWLSQTKSATRSQTLSVVRTN